MWAGTILKLCVVSGAGVALAACGGGASTKTALSSTSPASAAAALPRTGRTRSVRVDLLITGPFNATIKGTKGTCLIGRYGTEYAFLGSDYPDLGGAASLLSIQSPIKKPGMPPGPASILGGNIKSSHIPSYSFENTDTTGMTFSADSRRAILNQALSVSDSEGRRTNGRITGTIVCE